MGRQMKAEREKRALILESEGLRASEILKAEGQKQGQILQAEGRREAAFRDAEAREREAEAEAKATQMVSDAIAGGNAQAINYFIAQKYVEAISQFATSPNAKTILFPVEATQLIGTLGRHRRARPRGARRRRRTTAGAARRGAGRSKEASNESRAASTRIGGGCSPPPSLGILEVFVPGIFLVWMAAAAAVTGIVVALTGIALPFQLAIFALLAIAAVYGGRRHYDRNPVDSDDPKLNDRTARLIGQTVTVVTAIEHGEGRVKVGDSVWTARGPDAAAGSRVMVTAADGTCLSVRPAAALPPAEGGASSEQG